MFGTGQDEYSDGVPVYSLTGAAVPTWLKRVKLGGARYWVIGQSTGFLYAARVDCLREIQKRQAAEAVRGCMLHAACFTAWAYAGDVLNHAEGASRLTSETPIPATKAGWHSV